MESILHETKNLLSRLPAEREPLHQEPVVDLSERELNTVAGAGSRWT
jgi:hypothetical protein